MAGGSASSSATVVVTKVIGVSLGQESLFTWRTGEPEEEKTDRKQWRVEKGEKRQKD